MRPIPVVSRRTPFTRAALFTFFLTGCLGEPDSPDIKGPRARWRDQEPALYAYTVEHTCFCKVGPVHVMASRESVLVAQKTSRGLDSPVPAGAPENVAAKQDYSIEALFDEVESQLRRKHDGHGITYDKIYGFPAEVRIDFEKRAADEEYGLVISDFRAVNDLPRPVREGLATLTLKPYLGLCHYFEPTGFGCPVISVDGGPYANSISGIKGLEFEWGKEKTVLVSVKKTPEELQDAPPYEFTLIRETASVPVDSARFDILAGPWDHIQSASGPGAGGTLKIMGYKDIAYAGAFPLDMNGDRPANIVMLTLELKSGSLHLVSTLAIPGPASPAPATPAAP